ncbi:YraN family protein [Granulicella aggregans]|uniref:YraN family protein n=1 Tax=Granulicella aggregans TaxID=474949 RepID=UPI0021E09668|nr:YraN family protein [Granulicella aggregans]
MPIATKTSPSHLHSGPGIEQSLLHGIDSLAAKLGRASQTPAHLLTGLHGEEEALFYLRQRGYTVVARRWQTPRLPGDVDLVAWDGPCLCFVEVKTRTGRDIVPAEFAVDQHKQRVLRSLARVFCKRFAEHMRSQIPIRFDVVAVYLPPAAAGRAAPEIEHFTSAFPY